ncbi:Metal-sulfur cluster biosynthetic enzyme [Thalassobacillus cyri]|uniref:Metal-sulfur cluster biosynthetic enzyme n=1 Tax=Thalassobacillus cyri TaxID=571932 RepID=A0A1H3ZDG4_9BACI|nr:metal-sulfur cluster assembly factor [Thalassobacillus cyri]SEA21700.1 Metal-sulfur cluster biosynthetic enzyme [Thalassobacillus cyri]
MNDTKQATEKYWDALKEVMDPEFPISVVDMGLIRGIDKEGSMIKVTMTYTSTGCACMVWIESDIKERLLKEEEVENVEIEVQWSPAWTVHDMTEEGKNKMQHWGVRS